MDFTAAGTRPPVTLNVSVVSEKAAYGFKPAQTIDVDFMMECSASQEPQFAAPERKKEIVLVLDVSCSMKAPLGDAGSQLGSASRIELVRSSCDWLLRNLSRQHCSVGIVSFSCEARIVHPLMPLDTHLESLLESIAGLKTDGNTNMWEGMQLGADMLLRSGAGGPQSQASKIMIVLSDGEVNRGRRDIADAVAVTNDYTQLDLWMFAVSSNANTTLCEAVVRSCGGTFIAINDPEAVPAAFGSFCGADRLLEQASVKVTAKEGTRISIRSLSVQNRSTNSNQVQCVMGFLMRDTPRSVLFRVRVQLPEIFPQNELLQVGDLSIWSLSAAGDITVNVPLSIKFLNSRDDGDINKRAAHVINKEEIARAMRLGNACIMRKVAERIQRSTAAGEFATDIAILLQLASDFEDGRDDARMNSVQMAQECSNSRSMQSASRFFCAKSTFCSPAVIAMSSAASADVAEKMASIQTGKTNAYTSPGTTPSFLRQASGLAQFQGPNSPNYLASSSEQICYL